MDEKTAELRDLFVDATGSETVTERQEAARGYRPRAVSTYVTHYIKAN